VPSILPAVLARILLLMLLTGLVVSVSFATASRNRPQPIPIQASSITQVARQLIWRVDMSQPFSPAGLAAGRRSLCLLVERLNSGSVSGQLCVAPPARGGRSPQLIYQPISGAGPGPANAIAAIVTRSSDQELTAAFTPASLGRGYQSLRWQVISTLRPPGCIPAKPDRVGCLTLFPSSPTLAELHTPRLVGCVPSGPAFVDNGPSNRRVIALTFDDGPWYDTSQFLDILEQYHVPATFFEIGEQISTYGEGGAIERRMLADGDMIGDHTWSHANVSGAGSFAAGQISQAATAIEQATHGFTPCLFRAPFGAVSGPLISEARSMGFTTIQWDIDPRDWALPGVSAIYDNVIANAHPGAIVIQHDGGGNRSETLAALPQEIQALRSRGYQFVTVTQLLGQALIYR
jgi:peptidoglycan/xylan/chitin deacetylase (PgdA/CDA1 family)